MKYPSVTPKQIQDEIVSVHYFRASQGVERAREDIADSYMHLPPKERPPLPTTAVPTAAYLTTFCLIVLRNGYSIYGKSACADARNFDAALGRHYAYEDAVRQVWPLLGFRLRDTLAKLEKSQPLAGRIEAMGGKTYIGSKVIHAVPMNRADYNALRGWELPADENGGDAGFLVQYADQDQSNVEGFTGYISWSPADVFKEAYKEIHHGETDDESA